MHQACLSASFFILWCKDARGSEGRRKSESHSFCLQGRSRQRGEAQKANLTLFFAHLQKLGDRHDNFIRRSKFACKYRNEYVFLP